MPDSFATQRTVACQAPLSMGYSRQEHWSGLPFPSLGDLSFPGIKPASPALAGGFFTIESPGKLTNAEAKQRLTFHHEWEGGRPCVSLT